MQLTRFTDLGLRVLMYLAHHEGDEPATSAEIAAAFQVPYNHIIKVVHRLSTLGWVHTQRGRGGGMRLAVDPGALRLGDVLRTLEDGRSLVDCAEPPCVLRRGCLLKGALDEALSSFYDGLNRKTVADVCGPPTGRALVRLQRTTRA